MRKIVTIIIALLVSSIIYGEELFIINDSDNNIPFNTVQINNDSAKVLRITNTGKDTLSIHDLLDNAGITLISFSLHKNCEPVRKEYNRLYNEGIIQYLKDENVRLIILSQEYPFINVGQLDSLAKDSIESDFEIYYCLDSFVHSVPNLWIIGAKGELIFHSIGVKEDYSSIKDSVRKYIQYRCPKCKGSGRVRPNRYGGPDESVGTCPLCYGRGCW